jgi:hypothetical protein
MKEKLINAVIEQIKTDIENGDLTAIAEMLERLPRETLAAYLPEEGGAA